MSKQLVLSKFFHTPTKKRKGTDLKEKPAPKKRRVVVEDDDDDSNDDVVVEQGDAEAVELDSSPPPTTSPAPRNKKMALQQSVQARVEELMQDEHAVAKQHKKFAQKLSKTSSNVEKVDSTSEQDLKRAFHACRPGQKATGYTPLEQQFVAIKRKHQDMLLVIEVGYKFKFYGQDAEIAAELLNIFCYRDKNFNCASIPTQRLYIHVRKLVESGYKVGVVRQTETAALKAVGDNKNKPFERGLTEVYTRGTLIGDAFQEDANSEDLGPIRTDGFFMCVYETPGSQPDTVDISLVAVNFNTGHVVHDTFTDNNMRHELETRLAQLEPLEILTNSAASNRTVNLLSHPMFGRDSVRVEVVPDDQFATPILQEFFQDASEGSIGEMVFTLPAPVQTCLNGLVSHLKEFGISSMLKKSTILLSFREHGCMTLDGSSLYNLNITSDELGRTEGSLVWFLKHTRTNFGARLLRRWVCQPLRSRKMIENRLEIVRELLAAQKRGDEWFVKLTGLLEKLPDLERALSQACSTVCPPQRFADLIKSLELAATSISELQEFFNGSGSDLAISKTVLGCPDICPRLNKIRNQVDLSVASTMKSLTDLRTEVLVDFSQFGEVLEASNAKRSEESQLDKELVGIRKQLQRPNLEYKSVLSDEYLIEVPKSTKVPGDWAKIGGTKAAERYRSPTVTRLLARLNESRETLAGCLAAAWSSILQEFTESLSDVWRVVSVLAHLDCLCSLAHVAAFDGFCCPEFTDEHQYSSSLRRDDTRWLRF
eukprot:c18789_g1_i2.p1 GENE.c18789_g1_i2~~c18789_g1_i2.p1  ORF type:complete len:774 (+),score=183.23 c18789_g1_i2:23-2323(+)